MLSEEAPRPDLQIIDKESKLCLCKGEGLSDRFIFHMPGVVVALEHPG